MMAERTAQLRENLARIRERIGVAANRVGRSGNDVTLVAVTKYVDAATAAALAEAGCTDLAESRPQELWNKVPLCLPGIHWHLIGHLQRNKVKRTLPLVQLIHSVDSQRLIQELETESAALNRRTAILLEVNISGDDTKTGFQPSEVDAALQLAPQLPHLEISGLMAMASREGDLAEARREFRNLRLLHDQLQRGPSRLGPELSMGMSGDFEVAIEEGATMVRIGSLLFEGILGNSG